MKKSIRQLFWWSFVVYMVLGPIEKLASSFDLSASFSFLWRFEPAMVVCTSIPLFYGIAFGAFFILKKYYPSQGMFLTSSLIFINAFFFISLRYLIQEILFLKLFGFANYFNDPTLLYYFFDNLYYVLIFSSIGAVVYFVNRSIDSETSLKNMEIDKRNMELSMLRSQINPHFLFNQLNSIYSLVYQKSDSALSAIAKLSDFLRYSLYEKKHKVPLTDELDSIRNFIALQKIRIGEHSFIELDFPKATKNISIQPYIFLPFVENALKHGQLTNSDHPVKISLAIKGNQLLFSTANLKSNAQKDESGGIGLESIKRRLALLYKDQYKLNIKDLPTRYEVYLSINPQTWSVPLS